MPSPLTIAPGTFTPNPSGIAPEKPAHMSQEEWDQLMATMRQQLYQQMTQDYRQAHPEEQFVPKTGTQVMQEQGQSTQPRFPVNAPTATPPGNVGLPNPVVTPMASKATSFLSGWLSPQVLIPAAAGVAGTLIQKSAANNATDAQTEAADKALALTEKMYEQDRADYAPYRNIGAFSLGQLGHLTGMPADFGTKAVEGATAGSAAAPKTSAIPPNTLGGRTLNAIQDQRVQAASTAGPLPELQTLRDLGATRQTASSFVRMRAPDGEEADVPPHEIPMFEAHGAVRV